MSQQVPDLLSAEKMVRNFVYSVGLEMVQSFSLASRVGASIPAFATVILPGCVVLMIGGSIPRLEISSCWFTK